MAFIQIMSTYFVRYGYAVVFLGVALESTGLPLPGETTLLAAGFFASQGHFSLPLVMGVAALGAIAGDNAGYLIGRRYGRPFVERYGRYVLLSPTRLAAMQTFFSRHGAKAMVMARFVSGLRVIAACSAGIAGMPWRTFMVYNALGGILWAGVISSLGYLFGHSWMLLERWMGRVGFLSLALVAVGGLSLLLLRQARKLKAAVQSYLPRTLSIRELVTAMLTLTAIALFAKIVEDVITHASAHFDTTTLENLHRLMPSRFEPLLAAVTSLGSVPVVFGVALVGSALLIRWRASRQLQALLGVTLLAQVLNVLLKNLVHRQRPHLWAGMLSLTDYSFPSGHSMAAMAVYGIVAYLLSEHYPRQAWLIKLLAAGVILAIGISRMLLGVHWPTDVLGGYAAGACVLCAGVYWYEGHTGLSQLLVRYWTGKRDAS